MTTILRRSALWVSALVTAGFGLGLLFAPTMLADLYAAPSTEATITLSRLFGGVTLAFTVLALGALRVEDVPARRVIDASFLAAYAFIALATIWNVWQYGMAGAEIVNWATLALYVVLAATFGYFLLGEDRGPSVRRARPIG